jgi:hypothetical protein
MFEEGCDVIFKAFNEEKLLAQGHLLHDPAGGPYRGYTLKDITLVPRPLRRPCECWQPIQSGSTAPSTSWPSTAFPA